MFWGRTLRFGNFNAAQTDFGHNIKSYEMIYNANQMFADRPWEGLSADRATLLARAWDDPRRAVEPAAAELRAGQRRAGQRLVDRTTRPTRRWQRSTWATGSPTPTSWPGVRRHGSTSTSTMTPRTRSARRSPGSSATGEFTDLRKSFFGKNMLHATSTR